MFKLAVFGLVEFGVVDASFPGCGSMALPSDDDIMQQTAVHVELAFQALVGSDGFVDPPTPPPKRGKPLAQTPDRDRIRTEMLVEEFDFHDPVHLQSEAVLMANIDWRLRGPPAPLERPGRGQPKPLWRKQQARVGKNGGGHCSACSACSAARFSSTLCNM